MRTLIAVLALAWIPLAAAASLSAPRSTPGGKHCQLAESGVPTPGLSELVLGSKTRPVPSDARLSEAQVETLADFDTKLRRVLKDVEARAARLPAGESRNAVATLDAKGPPQLPALVERFVSEAACDAALVIDVETAHEFRLANAQALAARESGDKLGWCPLCLAVRRGIEADFAWRSNRFGELSPEQAKEATLLAHLRDDVRRQWSARLREELRPAQIAWLRQAQMQWIKTTLKQSVVDGMKAMGEETCNACSTSIQWKCEFCSIVLDALDEAKAKS